jgi:hypothetical protein
MKEVLLMKNAKKDILKLKTALIALIHIAKFVIKTSQPNAKNVLT